MSSQKANQNDDELELIQNVLFQLHLRGISLSPSVIADILVAYKSKPFIIFAGPPEFGKEILVDCFFHTLTNNDPSQYQKMIGHPWWANMSPDVTNFVQTQSCWNTLKIETLIETAWAFENRKKNYIGALISMSPGEVQEYFSEIAFQIRSERIMRLPTTHFSEPIPFPRNLSIVGTINTSNFSQSDYDLLFKTSILQNPVDPVDNIMRDNKHKHVAGRMYQIRPGIRNSQQAIIKLFALLRRFHSGLLPFFQISKLLDKKLSAISNNAIQDGLVYLSNAWSFNRHGLYSRDHSENLKCALDFAITQCLLLPCSEEIVQSVQLQNNLRKILSGWFPHSNDFVNQLAIT
jgi:hypothetical protein